MNILLTGANGYIGQRLLPVLLEQGHDVYCSVRSKWRFEAPISQRLHIVELDFLELTPQSTLPSHLDVAFYLIHSMSGKGDFTEKEATAARNFLRLIEGTSCRQIIYLSGIVNEDELSDHLNSRLEVERILRSGLVPVTVLRAGIIVGSGSASFEIIRDLVEKLPIMVAPRWLNTLCQPIAIRNVIEFLYSIMGRQEVLNQDFDIGGPDVLSYKQMLLQFAQVRKLRRFVFTVPIMTPKLSSYWLYFITSTSFHLAVNLVDSMKVNVVARPNNLAKKLGIELISYKKAVEMAFQRIEQNMVLSSWKDAFSSFGTNPGLMEYVEVPQHGCFVDRKTRTFSDDPTRVLDRVWAIGGKQGWYYGNTLWKLRGMLDKAVGGVGLRRGRTNTSHISPGDVLDFWRVLVADRDKRRLLLFAEMKLPGEAWLEFKIIPQNDTWELSQVATFRPRGLWGRLYWYGVLPFHFLIFNGMIRRLVKT
jgi:uncharacterized protein YbjT (DUF2867 family)